MKETTHLYAVAHPDDAEVMHGHSIAAAERAWVSVATLGELGIDMLDPLGRCFCPFRP